jgi:hypothetical protein
MLNLGGGSDAGALIVTNASPTDLLSATKLTPLPDASNLPTDPPSLALAQAVCYYSGNCHLAPYNSLRGNPFFNLDARLAKNIKLGENRNLQLIFQAFNLTNHANYGNNLDGTVATLNSNGDAATPNSGFSKALGFINPTSSTLPRAFTAEFGARFSF